MTKFFTGFIFHLIFGLFVFQVNAQDSAIYKISTQPLQFALLEVPIFLEKETDFGSWGALLAFRPGVQNGGQVYLGQGALAEYELYNYTNFNYNAATLGFAPKFYIKNRTKYFQPIVFYRYWWFNEKNIRYGDLGGSQRGLRTDRQHQYGLKLLVAEEMFKSQKWFGEAYGGVGVRFKTYFFKIRNGSNNFGSYLYREVRGQFWRPSLHLGFRVGIMR